MVTGVTFGWTPPHWTGLKGVGPFWGIWAGLVSACTGVLLVWVSLNTPATPITTYLGALSAVLAGLLLAAMIRMGAIWSRFRDALLTKPHRRTDADRKHIREGFRELFAYLLASLFALTLIAFAAGNEEGGWLSRVQIKGTLEEMSLLHLTIFCTFFVSSFIPLLTGFALQAKVEASLWKSTVLRSNVISRSSLVISSLAISGIVALAWAAGAKKFDMSDDFGVYVTLIVVLCFLVFIISPHLARFVNDRLDGEEIPLTHAAGISSFAPETLISWIDSILVRLVAPLSGATQQGAGVPHLLVVLLVLPLSAMGFVLGSPFGLVPIFLAMLVVLSLGRRWAWVEEDRETASRLQSTEVGRTSDIHVGFDNDLKDEALLGYASLFILVPLALFQIQGSSHAFEQNADLTTGNQFLDWLRFFGAELAKAVPFVDWWEIYQVDVRTPFSSENETALAKHLTFAARAMVDLVIMAALVQAFGIWQRGRTQNRLYDAGHINSFDPFTEQEFFERGMKPANKAGEFLPKRKFVKRVQEHISNSRDLNLQPQPYSARRLSELIRSENEEVSAGARWMIREFGVLAGSPQERLAQLNQQWGNLKLPQLASQRTAWAKEQVRAEKLRLEQLLIDLKREIEQEGGYLPQANAGLLLALVEEIHGAPEFSFARIIALELLATRNSSEFSLAAFAAHLMTATSKLDHFEERPDWARLIKLKFDRRPRVYLSNYAMRRHVYDALESFASNLSPASRRWAQVLDLLDWMAEADASKEGCLAAKALAQRLRSQ